MRVLGARPLPIRVAIKVQFPAGRGQTAARAVSPQPAVLQREGHLEAATLKQVLPQVVDTRPPVHCQQAVGWQPVGRQPAVESPQQGDRPYPDHPQFLLLLSQQATPTRVPF